jgi:hypothetical protein
MLLFPAMGCTASLQRNQTSPEPTQWRASRVRIPADSLLAATPNKAFGARRSPPPCPHLHPPVHRRYRGGHLDEASREQPGEHVAGINSALARTPATRIAVSITPATLNGRRVLLQRRSMSAPIPARPRHDTAPRIWAVSGVSDHGHNAMATAG